MRNRPFASVRSSRSVPGKADVAAAPERCPPNPTRTPASGWCVTSFVMRPTTGLQAAGQAGGPAKFCVGVTSSPLFAEAKNPIPRLLNTPQIVAWSSV